MERFIERGTTFQLNNAKLAIYETNCMCKNIKFHFNKYVITLMIEGHKTIETKRLKFEFFPGTVLIPEKETIIDVSIPNASIENPTKCLVLEIHPDFIQRFYKQVVSSDSSQELLYDGQFEANANYFISNNKLLVDAFLKLYHIHFDDQTAAKSLVEDLCLKEILLRIFQTEGLYLMIENFYDSIKNDDIRKVTSYIANHLDANLSVKNLCKIAGMGHTSFYKKFKSATGYSPNEYVIAQRINYAKVLIRKSKYSLKEVAYKSGFNSYEYFSTCFKNNEQIKPSEFRTQVLNEKPSPSLV